LSVQLVSKISNLCDHKSPTLQTDGQTDRRHAILRPRICTKVHCAVIKHIGVGEGDGEGNSNSNLIQAAHTFSE